MTYLRSMATDASARQFAILTVAAVACTLLGGSSRADVPGLVLLRPALVLALAALAVLPGPRDWRALRVLAVMLVLFALSMLIQLVPIPAGWWLQLAGRARYAIGVQAGGARALPLSLAPDLTVNSVLSLLPAACALLAYAGMRPEHRWRTVWLFIGMAVASLAVALIQVGGQGDAAYLYGRQHEYGGLMANRNHQAVLLGAALPAIALAARQAVARRRRWLVVALTGVGVVILPMILLTGSRQGVPLGVVALVICLTLVAGLRRADGRAAFRGRTVALALAGLAAALVLVAVATNRAASFQRFGALSVSEDTRWRNLPSVVAMTKEFLPWGIGYGAFDPAYRGFEPDALLESSYFNHAHNDALELVLTGGVPATLLLAALIVFVALRAAKAFGPEAQASRRTQFLDRVGVAVFLLFGAASLVDYPIRTPMVTFVVALALCWLAAPPAAPASTGRRRRRVEAGEPT